MVFGTVSIKTAIVIGEVGMCLASHLAVIRECIYCSVEIEIGNGYGWNVKIRCVGTKSMVFGTVSIKTAIAIGEVGMCLASRLAVIRECIYCSVEIEIGNGYGCFKVKLVKYRFRRCTGLNEAWRIAY
ncbi:hypothetical protein CEXT_371421 [Caerostris extrusa]|uniref:Uncharacterized protein n=1 Tax=Caerostris extrusa TaxID=172846 RepID=A0AAV4R2V6_CAEEX|nr:hypothetical protein CEXT_371421 [Caerostris extrusa]